MKWQTLGSQWFCTVPVQSSGVGKGVGFPELLQRKHRIGYVSHHSAAPPKVLQNVNRHYYILRKRSHVKHWCLELIIRPLIHQWWDTPPPFPHRAKQWRTIMLSNLFSLQDVSCLSYVLLHSQKKEATKDNYYNVDLSQRWQKAILITSPVMIWIKWK